MTTPSRRNSLRAVLVILSGVALVIGFIAVLYGVNGSDKADASMADSTSTTAPSAATVTETSTETSTTATTATTTASAPGACYKVKLQKHIGGDVIDGGADLATPEGRQKVLTVAKQDPSVLQLYYNASPIGESSPMGTVTDIGPMENGACYTARGVQAYNEWSTLFKYAKIESVKLPSTGINTGVNAQGKPFQVQGTIPKGTGSKVTYVDANDNPIESHDVRNECANIVTIEKIVHIQVIVTVEVTPSTTITKSTPTTVTRTTSTTTRTTSLAPKIPGQDPGARGNAGNGAGKNQDSGPGVFQPTKPAAPPSTSRVNPPPPQVVVTSPSWVSIMTTSSTPTVAPSTQPVNNGWVNPDPTSGAACNPKFQSC